ncbi:MAG: ester cyclase [bacterium]
MMQPIDLPTVEGTGVPSPNLAEADVDVVHRFVEAVAREEAGTIKSRFFAADFVEHEAGVDFGAQEFIASLVARRARFPDVAWTVELLVSVAGLVVCHSTMTHREPTGAIARGRETVVLRIENGRFAECWRMCDERLSAADECAGGP